MPRLFILPFVLLASTLLTAQTLPSLTYSKQKAGLKGQLTHVQHVDSIRLSYQPVAGGSKVELTTPLREGSFSFTPDIRVTQMVELTLLDKTEKDERKMKHANVLLTPGAEVSLSTDLAQTDSTGKTLWQATGSNAAFNTDLANYSDEYDVRRLYQAINGMGLRKMLGKTIDYYGMILKATLCDAIETLKKDKRVGAEFKEYVTVQYQLMYGVMLSAGEKIMRYANGGGEDYAVTPEMYADYVSMNPLASNGALYGLFGVAPIEMAPALSEASEQTLTEPECTRQLSEAQRFISQIEDFHPLSDSQKDSLTTLVPNFDDIILGKNAELLAQMDANKKNKDFSIQEISDTLTGTRIFQEIVGRYKGRPVLVDFWATWCGPCRAAMKTVLPVKEELWDKCAFVYVTGVTSPRATWNTTIPTIHGDHFYVTEAQWTTLLAQFEAQGIPTYVIVNKQGQIQKHYIGFPGVDEIRAQLIQGL